MTLPLPEPKPGEPAAAFVHRAGQGFALFDEQDSGCISYGLAVDGRRFFVKTANTPAAVESLRSAVRLHRAVRHHAITPLLQVEEAADSPVLVYPWFEGWRWTSTTAR